MSPDVYRLANDVQIHRSETSNEMPFVTLASSDSAAVFESGGELVVSLLELVDGRRTLQEIVDELSTQFSVSDQVWTSDLPAVFQELLDLKVVVPV